MHSHHHAASDEFSFALVGLLSLPLVMLGLYVLGLRAQRRSNGWSRWRTASFLAGSALVIAALLPPVAALAHQDLRVHMGQHLLLGMLGPIGLVLGAPVTLALRSLPTAQARLLSRALRSRPIHLISHPAIALVLNIGGMVALYATPLYAAMATSPTLHLLVHLHFLAAGCLYSWAIAGVDPGPKKPHAYRLVVLFLGMAVHATLSKAMYAYGWPRGTSHGTAEIEQAAQIMFYGGDVSELLLAVALFATWKTWGTSVSRDAIPSATVGGGSVR